MYSSQRRAEEATGGMVLESGVLPPPLQLYAAAAAHLSSRPPWAPLLHYPGAASLFGMPGTFGHLARPRYPPPGLRAPTGPPSEDSGSETHSPNKGTFCHVKYILSEIKIENDQERISLI